MKSQKEMLDETYAYLNQVRAKESVIRRRELLRDELRACLLPRAIRYDRERVQGGYAGGQTAIVDQIASLDAELAVLRAEKAALAASVSRAIERLPDENEKTVLTAFYIARRRMDEIADETHYSVRWLYRLRGRGVQHLGELLTECEDTA